MGETCKLDNTLVGSFWRVTKPFYNKYYDKTVKQGALLKITEVSVEYSFVNFIADDIGYIMFDTSIKDGERRGYLSETDFLDFFNSYFVSDVEANSTYEKEFKTRKEKWLTSYYKKWTIDILLLCLAFIYCILSTTFNIPILFYLFVIQAVACGGYIGVLINKWHITNIDYDSRRAAAETVFAVHGVSQSASS